MADYILTFCICTVATTLASICGVGGGTIIKPLLDLLGDGGAATCSFLSCCAVLVVSCYSLLKKSKNQSKPMQMKNAIPLALGATIGGIIGKIIFNVIKNSASNEELVLCVQSIVLAAFILACIVYTLEKKKIKPLCIEGNFRGTSIGLALGVVSSFLGIGGGPINLIVLHFFYGYNSKDAAKYSLFIVLLSQCAGLITTIVTNEIPKFSPIMLLIVAVSGLCGGIIGKAINSKIDSKAVDKLFLGFLSIVFVICIINAGGIK